MKYKSFRRFNENSKSVPYWDFKIFETYISFCNNKKISVTSNDTCLPICPSLSEILSEKLPSYRFDAADLSYRQINFTFLLFGKEDNVIKTDIAFVNNSKQMILINLAHPKYETARAGSLVFYLVPLNIIGAGCLYLRCLPDPEPCLMGASCNQRGFQLCTNEPVVHLSGPLMWSKLEEFPFLICQKTKEMRANVVRVHTRENQVCKLNDVRSGKNYLKVHFNYTFDTHKNAQVDVKMSMVKDALISFKFNPFLYTEWRWNRKSVPIVYVGPSVLIPGCCATKVEYKNIYYCSVGVSITCIILSVKTDDNDFEIDPCEWKPSFTTQILVKNKSVFPNRLESGTCLGEAYFICAEKFFMADVLTKKMLRNLTTCLCLPGGICLNATKLTKLSKTYTHSQFVDGNK